MTVFPAWLKCHALLTLKLMGALLILIAPAFAQQEDPLGNPILYSFVVDTPTIYAAGVSPDGQYLVQSS